MKVPVWMLFGLILAILLMDLITLLVVRADLIEAINIALDAAFVEGISEEDLFKGESFIEESKAREAALTYFKKNLNLNHNLENRFLQKTKFELTFKQEQTQPMISAIVSTTVTTMVPKLVGHEGINITVRKKQYFLHSYKNMAPVL
ncbi:MAG: hypothetical protein ACOX2N_07640 [Peptococcia bacterium]|jgi:nitrogen regulatory protein PII